MYIFLSASQIDFLLVESSVTCTLDELTKIACIGQPLVSQWLKHPNPFVCHYSPFNLHACVSKTIYILTSNNWTSVNPCNSFSSVSADKRSLRFVSANDTITRHKPLDVSCYNSRKIPLNKLKLWVEYCNIPFISPWLIQFSKGF